VTAKHRELGARQRLFVMVLIWAALSGAVVFFVGQARAAVLEATPKFKIDYYFNDNIYAMDPAMLNIAPPPVTVPPRGPQYNNSRDLASASWINYLVGILFRYSQGSMTAELSGYAGYSQYVSLGGWVTKGKNASDPADWNSANAVVNGMIGYNTRRFGFELEDTLNVTRDLQQIFGASTDAIGYWSLYTDNVISASIKFSPTPKFRLLGKYAYDTLVFAAPENNLSRPPDSIEHRAYLRGEYDFSPKLTGFFDAQYADRSYTEIDNFKFAGYTFWQGLLGIRYHFSPNTYMELAGGYSGKHFKDINKQTTARLGTTLVPAATFYPVPMRLYRLDDMAAPVAMFSFVSETTNKYRLIVSATYGGSTYGQNLYFNYMDARARFTYYFTPKLTANLQGGYNQAVFDREDNSRQWLWKTDRIDNLTTIGASLHWDILQKGGQGTLSLEAGWNLQMRDSNIDNRNDYTTACQGLQQALYGGSTRWPYSSFDGNVNVYYIEFQILPTILIGS
jgi:hypothetical protein